MSDDSGEKTFDAPPSRIAKARRQGNVPRAQEFGANLSFVAAALTAVAVAGPIGACTREALIRAAHGDDAMRPCAAIVALALLPLTCAALSGLFGGILQTGGLIVVPVVPKFERLLPAEGIKRMCSRETLTHAVRALAAFVLAAFAIVPALVDLLRSSTRLASTAGIASIAWTGAQHVVYAAAAVGSLFAFAEYGVARRNWLRTLRMSLSELKRELRESDGDPLARSRRRSLHRSLIRGALASVRDASFVVVNPTHVAVALEYRPPEVPVPRVLVRAADEMALRVRELAAERRIPIVENIALARALYHDTGVGDAIPPAQYVAVAEVVAALIRSGALA